jgi:hypothetical protein
MEGEEVESISSITPGREVVSRKRADVSDLMKHRGGEAV